MRNFTNWVMNTPMVTNGVTTVVYIFVAVMMVYSIVYYTSNSGRNGQMKSPTTVAVFGAVAGSITLFIGLVSTYLMTEMLHLFS